MSTTRFTPEQKALSDSLLGDVDNSTLKSKFKSVDEKMDRLRSNMSEDAVKPLEDQVCSRIMIGDKVVVPDGAIIAMIRHDIEECIKANLITTKEEGAERLEEYRKLTMNILTTVQKPSEVNGTVTLLRTAIQNKIADLTTPLLPKLQTQLEIDRAKITYQATYQKLIGQKRFATLRMKYHGNTLKMQEQNMIKLGMTKDELQAFKTSLRTLPAKKRDNSSRNSLSSTNSNSSRSSASEKQESKEESRNSLSIRK